MGDTLHVTPDDFGWLFDENLFYERPWETAGVRGAGGSLNRPTPRVLDRSAGAMSDVATPLALPTPGYVHLYVNEVIQTPTSTVLNGLRMVFPGGEQVIISRAEQDGCP